MRTQGGFGVMAALLARVLAGGAGAADLLTPSAG